MRRLVGSSEHSRWLINLALAGLCVAAGLASGGLIALSPFITLAVAVALIGGLALLSSLQVGLFGLIGVAMLVPFAAIPMEIGFNPTLLDGVLLLLSAVWLIRIFTRQDEKLITSPLDGPIGVFILLAFVSFAVGLRYGGLNKNVLRHFAEVIISISLFFMVQNAVKERRQLEQIALVLILAGSGAALLGVILYFMPRELTVRLLSTLRIFRYPSGWGVLRFVEDDPSLPMRATSTSIDPNVLGGLLILVTSLTAPQLFAKETLIRRVWVIPMLLIMFTCMILTFSRGSLVGLGVALVFMGLVRYRKLLLLGLISGLVFLLLPQTQTYISHFHRGLLLQDRATLMRLGEYKDALTLISRHPWFGVGFIAAPSIDLYIGVSNVYLLIAEEMGLIGLGAFLLVMLVFFLHTLPALGKMKDNSGLAAILLGLEAALIGSLVGGLFDHYFFNLDFPHSVALFWLYVSLAVTAARLGLAENQCLPTHR